MFLYLINNEVVVCRRQDMVLGSFPSGTKVYLLGLADPSLPPGKTLLEVSNILLADVKPLFEVL